MELWRPQKSGKISPMRSWSHCMWKTLTCKYAKQSILANFRLNLVLLCYLNSSQLILIKRYGVWTREGTREIAKNGHPLVKLYPSFLNWCVFIPIDLSLPFINEKSHSWNSSKPYNLFSSHQDSNYFRVITTDQVSHGEHRLACSHFVRKVSS